MRHHRTEELLQGIPKALLNWYDFQHGSRILYIGKKDSYAEVLEKYAIQLLYADCKDLKKRIWQERYEGYFDYAVCVELLEKEEEPELLFAVIQKLLRPEGIFLAGMNNRLGLRYFCGDQDPYTCRSFDGIEDYRRAYTKKEDRFQGRMYDRQQLTSMLLQAGWKADGIRFFSVLTDLRNPSFLYAQDSLPNEDLSNRVFSTYNHPDTVFLDEEPLYQSMIENGMFHQMANAYLMECTMEGRQTDVTHVTASMERGRDSALLTVIHRSGIVEKRAAYPEGRKRLEQIVANGEALKLRGLATVSCRLSDGICQMPYIAGETGQIYLKKLLQTDKEAFFERLDHFRDLILQSSDIETVDSKDGVILQKGYLDLVPLNSFYVDGNFMFFDQEFCEEHCPAALLIQRMISGLYAGDIRMQKLLPAEELYIRYGIAERRQYWQEMEWKFLSRLLKQEELRIYHESCRKNPEIINANRHRMNYSEMEYQRLFADIFKGTGGRKLILFGSGIFAKRFIGMYGREYPADAIVDNNEERWGKELEGVRIQPPAILRELKEGEYKVIICIKNFLSVVRQLKELGVKNYSVFDPGKSYPCRQTIMVPGTEEKAVQVKKYHIGYVAGVFDMFHVGHVNLLRRAKEQCDCLIVGVVPDEGVYRQKKKYPIIPEEDRVEVLCACRFADQVELLPLEYASIQDAYKKYHFDCMFSGDDHNSDIGWLADQAFLEKSGVDIVFFSYTEKVSSTKLREQLKKDSEV